MLVWEETSDERTEWHFEPDTFVPLAKRTVAVLDDSGGGAGQGKRNAADGDRQALAPSRANGSAATNGGAKEARLWYIVTDHLGTPREMLSEDGSLVWAAEYTTWGSVRRLWQANNDTGPLGNIQGHDPDGNPIYSTRVYGTDGNAALKSAENPDEYACPIRFQGQWADEESGLYYNRHRYYDPGAAQYLSPDPIGLSGGLRTHGYVEAPTGWIDPFGLAKKGGGGKKSGNGKKCCCGGPINKHDTNIHLPSKPHTNKTPGHWFASKRTAVEMAKTGNYSDIYLNKGLGNAVAGVKPNRRPDVYGVRHDGTIDQVEVPSKTDDVGKLRGRMSDNSENIEKAGGKAGDERIRDVKKEDC